MKRPLPLVPRDPRVSPEWELGMLHVLMKPKPQTRAHVEHRPGEQPWGKADERQSPEVLALAIALSRRLPTQWFVLDRLFVHAGVVHRRQFGYKLNLVPASNAHVPRAIRAALREFICIRTGAMSAHSG